MREIRAHGVRYRTSLLESSNSLWNSKLGRVHIIGFRLAQLVNQTLRSGMSGGSRKRSLQGGDSLAKRLRGV